MAARLTTDEFIDQARKVHGDSYDYGRAVYVRTGDRVAIDCPAHGEFRQTPSNHLKGHGCQKCGFALVGEAKRSSLAHFVTQAHDIHDHRYGYDSVAYVECSMKVVITCPTHGNFSQSPHKHLMGRGCPNCGVTTRSKKRLRKQEDFLALAGKVHGDRYDYSKVMYIGNKTNVTITCSVHGDFSQLPGNHQRGAGCPSCNESSGERAIRLHLERTGVTFVPQHGVATGRRSKRFDFHLPGLDSMIEYHGMQHYRPCAFGSKGAGAALDNLRKTIQRDREKKQWCRRNGVALLVIPFWQKDDIDAILAAYLERGERHSTPPPPEVVRHQATRWRMLREIVAAEQGGRMAA